MTTFSHCQMCRDRLEHTALFCPTCGTSTCSWDCYLRHMHSHDARNADPAGTLRGETTAPASSAEPSQRS
jgi:hypothetical protein